MKPDGLITRWFDALLRTPPLPCLPQEPGVQVIQPAPAYVRYRLCYWAVGHIVLIGVLLVFVAGPALGLWFGTGAGGRGVIAEVVKLLDGRANGVPAAMRWMVAGLSLVFAVVLALVVLGVIFRIVAGVFLVQIEARRHWYILGERTLTIREGVTRVREMTFTYANIQDVRLTAGPLSRYFGLAHVTVETAGGGATVSQEGKKPGLQMHKATLAGLGNAGQVRDALLERQRRCRQSGLGDELPAVEAPAALESDVLRELAAEATALRRAAERLTAS